MRLGFWVVGYAVLISGCGIETTPDDATQQVFRGVDCCVETHAQRLRVLEATAQQHIPSALCTDEGHQANAAWVVLNFILWAGLYTGLVNGFGVRAVPVHPLVASLMREGIYLPRRLAEPTTLAKLIERFRPPERYTTETDPSGTTRRAQRSQSHRLAYVFALLFAPELVAAYAAGATERVRGFIASSSYPDNTALYEAVAAVEAGHLGTAFSGDPANTLRSYFRMLFKRLNAPDQEVLWPKNPLAWRVFFVQHYGAMLPGLARYFAPGTTS